MEQATAKTDARHSGRVRVASCVGVDAPLSVNWNKALSGRGAGLNLGRSSTVGGRGESKIDNEVKRFR
jgi:hypothetical protein